MNNQGEWGRGTREGLNCNGGNGSGERKKGPGPVPLFCYPSSVPAVVVKPFPCPPSPFPAVQQLTHLWLFFAPSFSSSAMVSGNGRRRCTGPLAMSTVVCPRRDTALTSAPLDTR